MSKKTCPCHPSRWIVIGAVWMLSFYAVPASARTVTITDESSDRMASIAAEAPRLSFAGYDLGGVFLTSLVDVAPTRSFLLRLPLTEIPKGQRITRAELIAPVNYIPLPEVRLYVWRIVADWGAGVCYQYRSTRDKKVEWKTPGARGTGSDRAARPTGTERVTKIGEQVINVTEDVELWYKGASPNNGWIFTVEDEGAYVRFESPVYTNRGKWRLRVTYEPE